MKNPLSPAVAGALFGLASLGLASAAAASTTSAGFDLAAGATASLTFTVTDPTSFDIYTSGATALDPVLFLYDGPDGTGTLIGTDDDSCPDYFCGAVAGGFHNALFDDVLLAAGTYSVLVFDFGKDDAGQVTVTVSSDNPYPPAPVPLPAGLPLLAAPLALGAVLARRRARRG